MVLLVCNFTYIQNLKSHTNYILFSECQQPHYSDAKSPVVILTKLFDYFIILFLTDFKQFDYHIILYTSKTSISIPQIILMFDYHVISYIFKTLLFFFFGGSVFDYHVISYSSKTSAIERGMLAQFDYHVNSHIYKTSKHLIKHITQYSMSVIDLTFRLSNQPQLLN